MRDHDDLWLMEELPVDEPSELLRTMPEIRQYFDTGSGGVGFHSILDRPEALSKAWCRQANERNESRKLRVRVPRRTRRNSRLVELTTDEGESFSRF